MRIRLVFSILLVAAASAFAEPVTEWTFDLAGMPTPPTLYPDAEAPTGLVAVGADTITLLSGQGAVVWSYRADGPITTPGTVADLDGDGAPEVLFATDAGRVTCLNSAGALLWQREMGARTGAYETIAACDVHPEPGRELIFGFDDGWLHCLARTGEPLWRFHGDAFRVGPPAVGDADSDGAPEIIYGTDNGSIYCLSGHGLVEWRYSEHAPYGRSAPSLADLDGDGRVEVLITRSNVGNATCLLALDGASGAYLWRTDDFMQSYASIVPVDLDGDGLLETLHADKGNYLYCTNADGTERWRTLLAGYGIFLAPAVADLDGDGAPEIVVPIRESDQETGACTFVVGADGAIKERLKLGGSGNYTPAIADVDGDGALELIAVTERPNRVHCLTWGGAGKALWPSYRGDSNMTGSRVALGQPQPLPEIQNAGVIRTPVSSMPGANTWKVEWDTAVDANGFLELSLVASGGLRRTWVATWYEPATSTRLDWELAAAHSAAVSLRVFAPIDSTLDRDAALARHTPLASALTTPGENGLDALRLAASHATIEEAAAKAGADAGLLESASLDAQRAVDRLERLGDPAALRAGALAAYAEAGTRAQAAGRYFERLSALTTASWARGDTGSFLAWQDANPWDAFEPRDLPEALPEETTVRVRAFGDEFEDVAITVLNLGEEALDLRATFCEPSFTGQAASEPELARRVELRRSIRVPGDRGRMVNDALPLLDLSRTLTVPSGEMRQLWLVVDTHGLEAGTHELTLYLTSVELTTTIRTIPLAIEVLPVRLPEGVYAQMNWVGIDIEQTSAQQLDDMLDHGITVAYGPVLPSIALDANGEPAGPVDWSRVDAGLARVPAYFQVLWHAPPAVTWPEGVAPVADDPLAAKGFAVSVRALTEHLAAAGWGYERWAFYPIDEPWNTGFTLIPVLRSFVERVRAIDPQVRLYTDPTGVVCTEYAAEFKDLIDIWQPEMNILKRDPELRRWFQENAKTLWAYEATDPGKDLLPLGYYRGFPWLAWLFELDGAGFWVYKWHDPFLPLDTNNWSVVYPINDQVVPSRRWEALRDGQEDYRALYALRAAIAEARAAGKTEAADRAQGVMDAAVQEVIAWQAGRIDEITRQTRDYDLDFELLTRHRANIAEALIGLRE